MCHCAELAHSAKAMKEAEKRCPITHYLTRDNLDRYASTAPERVTKQFAKREKSPTDDELRRSIEWHSDPLNFVRRAAHGNVTRLSVNEGAADFAHSMLATVFETPRGSQLRLKPWEGKGQGKKRARYVLYDTRNGIEGKWITKVVLCPECKANVTELLDAGCRHPVVQQEQIRPERPETVRIKFAVCNQSDCTKYLDKRTMWLWTDDQQRCPVCGGGRRAKQIDVATKIE
jgi:hypothetical protein